MTGAQIQALDKRRSSLSETRQVMIPHWQDLQRYINPLRGRFNNEKPQRHLPDFDKLLNGASQKAARILAAGMQAGLTNPARQWFKLTTHEPENESRDVRMWCDEVHSRMMTIMSASNFYHALHGCYDEIGTFGTAPLSIEEDYNNVIRCRTLTAGTYYLAVNAQEQTDTFYRDLWLSAAQMVESFGEGNVSEKVRNAYQYNKDTLYEVRHAIEPDTKSRHPYKSVWWEVGGETPLRSSFYDVFPVMSPRWRVVGGDTYGYGPGTEALADVKALQKLTSSMLTGINKLVEPPLVAPESMVGRRINSYPNSVTYVPLDNNGKFGIEPLYQVPIPIDQLQAYIQLIESRIDSIMYVDLFLMLMEQDNRQMTATEVAERHEEKMLGLSPVLERLENELLTPAIERIFSIMSANNLIPLPPEGLAGGDIKIEFVSVLAQAQRMMGLAPIKEVIEFGGAMAGIFPEVLDLIDADETIRAYAENVGAPAKLIREPQDVEAIRQARQMEQQRQVQMEEMAQMAAVGKDMASGANALAGAELSSDSALNALLGANSAGGG